MWAQVRMYDTWWAELRDEIRGSARVRDREVAVRPPVHGKAEALRPGVRLILPPSSHPPPRGPNSRGADINDEDVVGPLRLWVCGRAPVAQNLGCDAIIGYTELITVQDALAVLTAIGTAAVGSDLPPPPKDARRAVTGVVRSRRFCPSLGSTNARAGVIVRADLEPAS